MHRECVAHANIISRPVMYNQVRIWMTKCKKEFAEVVCPSQSAESQSHLPDEYRCWYMGIYNLDYSLGSVFMKQPWTHTHF